MMVSVLAEERMWGDLFKEIVREKKNKYNEENKQKKTRKDDDK